MGIVEFVLSNATMRRLVMRNMTFRPPSEHNAVIIQGTVGCSWNHCTYCLMYREKQFRVRPLQDVLNDIRNAGTKYGNRDKLFLADGDALCMSMDHWLPILATAKQCFPRLRQVSSYATARNILEKTPAELDTLRKAGLNIVYMGPESGDEIVLKSVVKGNTTKDFIEAAAKLKQANIKNSVIFLLGVGGVERSHEHAVASAQLASAMDPEYMAALTLSVYPGTPLEKKLKREKFQVPDTNGILKELRTLVSGLELSNCMFRTNHASNQLPLQGTLPRDKQLLMSVLDQALDGKIQLRDKANAM